MQVSKVKCIIKKKKKKKKNQSKNIRISLLKCNNLKKTIKQKSVNKKDENIKFLNNLNKQLLKKQKQKTI